MITVKINGNWKMYWGEMRLPQGAESLGTVTDHSGKTGALIKLRSGVYVRGNAGGIANLPQAEVDGMLSRSLAASALGKIKSDRKSATSAANGAKGGRPPGSKNKKVIN